MSDFRALTLYLLRHGECRHNLEGRVAGHSDSPLTERGREQARAAGALLAGIDRISAFHFVSSPLHRAVATTEIARDAAGLSPYEYVCDRRLSELDCGDNTFRVWSDIESEMKADPKFDRWSWRQPRGESLADLYERVGEFLTALTRDTIVVSHAGPIRMIRAHYLRLPQADVLAFKPLHATIIRLSGGAETDWGG